MTTSATDDTAPMIGMAPADRCPSCGAEMAPDQRYCVECGNRRGKPRFSPSTGSVAAPVAAGETTAPRRFSSSATLLLGLAILLLALGTGVLIGNSGASGGTSLSGKPYKVTIYNGNGSGAGGGTGEGTSSGSGGMASAGGGSGSKSGSGSGSGESGGSGSGTGSKGGSRTASLTGKIAPTVNTKSLHTKSQRKKALNKVQHSTLKLNNGKQIGSESQTVGGKCAPNTIGCSHGKFTGQYFTSGNG